MNAAGRALIDHLELDHGRQGRELEGLPLDAVHRFEHLEQEMGLIELDHRHDEAGSLAS